VILLHGMCMPQAMRGALHPLEGPGCVFFKLRTTARVLQAMVKMEDLAGILGSLQKRRARSQPFVQLLVAGLCGNPKPTANSQALVSLLQQADLGTPHAHVQTS